MKEKEQPRVLYLENPARYHPERQKEETKRGEILRTRLSSVGYDLTYRPHYILDTSFVDHDVFLSQYHLLITHLFAHRFGQGSDYSPALARVRTLLQTHENTHHQPLPAIVYTGASLKYISDEDIKKGIERQIKNAPVEVVRKSDNLDRDVKKIDRALESLLQEHYLPLFLSSKVRQFIKRGFSRFSAVF